MTIRTVIKGEAEPSAEIALFPAVPADDTLKIALYAEWGRRKTQQLGTLIESVGMDNCFIASCDRGLGTIKSAVNFDNVCSVDSWNDMRGAYARASAKFTGPDKWVLVDGATSLLLDHVNSLFAATEEAYDLRAQHRPIPDHLISASRYLTKSDQVDGMAIYGRVGRDLTRLFQSWKGLGTNLVFTFLEELTGTNDKREKVYPLGPAIPGNLGYRAAMSTFDYVIRLWYAPNGSLMAGTRATGLYEARTREDQRTGIVIPPTIENFDLGNFVKLIRPNT